MTEAPTTEPTVIIAACPDYDVTRIRRSARVLAIGDQDDRSRPALRKIVGGLLQ